jgi:hypothetical protein
VERTKIRFVAVNEPWNRVSAAVKAARLVRRFAVIQEMYRPDKAEDGQYFEEALCRGRRAPSVAKRSPMQWLWRLITGRA